jgi:hypothetical protein
MDDVEEGVFPGVAEDKAADAAESIDCTGYHGCGCGARER